MAKIRNPLPLTEPWNQPRRREFFLDYLVKKHQWSVGVEVGVRTGRTLFHLLDNNPSLKMYAVDIDVGQFYSDEVGKKYQDRLVVLSGKSWDMAAEISESVDFVFIDAAHGRKSVIKDINAYQNLVKTPQGLTGHDVDFPAVQQALTECGILYNVGPDNVWYQH